MIRNLLVIAFRNLKRQRVFALLHVIGLSLGLMSCVLIWLYTSDELAYDTFHEKASRIYRINQTFIWGEDDALFGSTGPAVMQAIQSEVPEFESMTRVHTPGSFLMTNTSPAGDPIVFEEDGILAVDSNFLEVFTFPLLAGNPKTALQNPQSLVLTASMARKYFNTEQVLGRYLEIGEQANRKTYRITGVAQNIPDNSHIQFDFLLSMASFPRVRAQHDSWMWTTFVTFGVLRKDADPGKVAQKVAAVPGKYLEAFLQKYQGISYEEFLDSGDEWNLYIQPLPDIHLRSTNVYSRLNDVGDIQSIYILYTVGGLILLLSMINFINLSTARATVRAKEVGIRKVIGSGRRLLIWQFLTESLLYVLGSAIIALFLVELVLPFLNDITNKTLQFSQLFSPLFFIILVVVILFVGLLSGLYPAWYLSSFKPVQALKGKIIQGVQGGMMRGILVTVQFVISICIIACTLLIRDQVSYWKNMDLGFDRKNKIILKNTERLGTSKEAFRAQLEENPSIDFASFSSDTPPLIFDFDKFTIRGPEPINLDVNYVTTDEQFIPAYGLRLLHGRNFSRAFNDSTNIIVNEHLTRSFGYASPEKALGESLSYGNTDFKIVGIVANFNTSITNDQYPTAFFTEEAPIFRDPSVELTIALNRALSGEEMIALLDDLERSWKGINPAAPFNYVFQDLEYMQFFKETIRFAQLLRLLSGLAVCIACLGLFGLVAFIIEKRTKEIGIRKVLGASVSSIWILLSGEFGKLLLIGFLIAAPLSWYLMSQWLENYDVRTDISVLTLFMSGGLMLLIAVLTTSVQTLRASRMNPVDYLKEE